MNDSVIKRIDELGRVSIPKILRNKIGIENGDLIELSYEDNSIIIKKHGPTCIFCGTQDDITKFNDKFICNNCIKNLGNKK